MGTLNFNCRTVTPMFMAGADGKTAELRPPSIKGILRFWWRAMHAGDPEMREKEKMLFGGVSNSQAVKSQVKLSLGNVAISPCQSALPNHPLQVSSKGKTFPINVLEYMAYGVLEYNRDLHRNVLIRDYIMPGGGFTLNLVMPDIQTAEIDSLVKVAFCFGGLGSKAHNGYGSVDIDGQNEVSDKIFLELKQKMNNVTSPLFPAFSSGMVLYRTKNAADGWDGALADLAKAYRAARMQIENRHVYEKRQYIGAPLMADKKQYSFLDRHAKPYFMSVHKVSGKYRGYILYLPSEYAPGLAGPDKSKQWNQKFSEICMELNGFLNNDSILEVVR